MSHLYQFGTVCASEKITAMVMADSCQFGKHPHMSILKQIRVARGITREQLAEMVGTTPTTIYRKETGMRKITADELEIYAAALGCDASELLGESHHQEPQTIPIVGYVGAGGTVFPYDDHAKGQGMGEAEVPPFDHELNLRKTVAVEVKGDSMMPLISDGDRLFYDERVVGVAYEYVNKRCIVWLDNGQCLVKWVRQGSKAGHYNLESINPNEPIIKDAIVQWSAKVKNIVPR